MLEFLKFLNNYFFWGIPMLVLFIFSGIYFTILTKGVQIRKLFSVFKKENKTSTKSEKTLSPMQTLTAGLATTLGTGNIVAVGSAVILGGAGAVFWMWISSFFGMATAYAETYIAMRYRKKNKNGEFEGSPCTYIKDGLNKPKIAILYGVLTILCSFGMGNLAQGYASSTTMAESFGTPKWVIGICIAVFSGAIILGGMKKLGTVTEKLIPLISLAYVIGCLIVIIINFENFSVMLNKIFTQAFNLKSAGIGSAITSLQWGIKRGIFSNEAGLGSSAIIHAASCETSPHKQGVWAMLQVFFDTIIMCSLTAFTILLTYENFEIIDADKATVFAFSTAFGDYAGAFISVSIFLFAVMTVAGWSAVGAVCFKYVFGEKQIKFYNFAYIIVAFLGAVISGAFIWEISDIFNGAMALINLICIISLSKKIFKHHNYSNIKKEDKL